MIEDISIDEATTAVRARGAAQVLVVLAHDRGKDVVEEEPLHKRNQVSQGTWGYIDKTINPYATGDQSLSLAYARPSSPSH